MEDLNSIIQKERKLREENKPKANPKASLLDLKKALDNGTGVVNNNIVENVKKIEKIDEQPNMVKPSINKNMSNNYDEKEDEFTKQLLMKTKQFMSGYNSDENQKNVVSEHNVKEVINQPNNYKSVPEHDIDVEGVLKDTIMNLYVRERVENILKEYLLSDEGKKMIKTIVVSLFKKK